MNVNKNYFEEALLRFMSDNGLNFNQRFTLYDYKKSLNMPAQMIRVGEGFFEPKNHDLIVEGVVRNEMTRFLLSGIFYLEKEDCCRRKTDGIRGFELISSFPGARLPERSTEFSAGYDFYATEDIKFLPHTRRTIFTGVKAYMPDDEVLKLYNRSSNAVKRGLMMSNSVGIIDSDYYNNPGNEGNIGFDFYNFTDDVVVIKKGEKLGQGIFAKFFLADNDIHGGERTGGFGSTGE